MKRNLELIREILVFTEVADPIPAGGILHNEWFDSKPSSHHLAMHLALLIQGGYLLGEWQGIDANGNKCLLDNPKIFGLTWKGYELLDSIRDDKKFLTIFEVAKKVGNTSISFIEKVSAAIAARESGPLIDMAKDSIFGS